MPELFDEEKNTSQKLSSHTFVNVTSFIMEVCSDKLKEKK